MRERLQIDGNYTDINPSEFVPVEYRCLIKLDPVGDFIKTAGGAKFILPEGTRQQRQYAQMRATLIAVGGNAFDDWKGTLPQPGDRIIVEKYAGSPPEAGDLDSLYRLCNDKDIVAIVRATAAQEVAA